MVSAMEIDPETKTLKREGVPSEVNSFDIRALLRAIELRSEHGGEVVAITMGPPQAREALVDCLALGADRAVHLCDAAFAGSDTLATARALALALKREAYDVILCGRNSVDAETGQVGPELAELLDLPQITGARTLTIDTATQSATSEREIDDGIQTIRAVLPVLVTATEDLAAERFPSKAMQEAARSKPCLQLSAADLSKDSSLFGAAGSPTRVAGLQQVKPARLAQIIESDSADEAAAQLTRRLVQDHGIFSEWRVGERPTIATIPASVNRTGASEVWVLAEILAGSVRPVVRELLGKAHEIAKAISSRASAVLLGSAVAQHAAELAAFGADRVLLADDPRLGLYQTELYAAALTPLIQSHAPGILLVPATAWGRDLAPRLAARLGVGLTGDCIDLGLDAQGRLVQYKPAFGGSIVAPILSSTTPEMATVRPGMLAAMPPDHARPAVVEVVHLDLSRVARSSVVDQRRTAESAADLDTADVAIGIGMGIGSAEQIAAVQPLRELLGAALCTTRDVADAGWLPRHHQVGLTGRAIAPKLYFAIGIRGAFEHTVGVRRAGLIVAINKNARAPIFKSADYGIVGDYRDVLPALHRHLHAAQQATSA